MKNIWLNIAAPGHSSPVVARLKKNVEKTTKKKAGIYQDATSQNKLHNRLEGEVRQAAKPSGSLSLTLLLMEQKLMGRRRRGAARTPAADSSRLHKSRRGAVTGREVQRCDAPPCTHTHTHRRSEHRLVNKRLEYKKLIIMTGVIRQYNYACMYIIMLHTYMLTYLG